MLTLEQAERISDGVFNWASVHALKPLTVMVLDAAGIPVLFKRSDNSPWLRFDIARAKAWGCLAMGIGGRALAARADNAPALFDLVNTVTGGKVAAVPGGVLVRGEDGALLGALGVSGDTPDNDEHAAIAGCVAAGLRADTGA